MRQSLCSLASAMVERDNPAADAHVIELLLLGREARFDVSQTFPVGELRERHAVILIEAGEALYLEVAAIPYHTLP